MPNETGLLFKASTKKGKLLFLFFSSISDGFQVTTVSTEIQRCLKLIGSNNSLIGQKCEIILSFSSFYNAHICVNVNGCQTQYPPHQQYMNQNLKYDRE